MNSGKHTGRWAEKQEEITNPQQSSGRGPPPQNKLSQVENDLVSVPQSRWTDTCLKF